VLKPSVTVELDTWLLKDNNTRVCSRAMLRSWWRPGLSSRGLSLRLLSATGVWCMRLLTLFCTS